VRRIGGRQVRRQGRLSVTATRLWAVSLVAWLLYAVDWKRDVDPIADLAPDFTIAYAYLGESISVTPLRDSGSVALLFVSPTCGVCISHADRLMAILTSLEVDQAFVVPTSSFAEAGVVAPYPEKYMAEPLDVVQRRLSGSVVVPRFVVVEGGSELLRFSGMPGRMQAALWALRLAGGS